jgi:hypothetical protein
MFVPAPVISLAIKPVGKETPNFSRALNRFQKEDPTFKVHLDHESKEVRISILSVHLLLNASVRRSYLEWANCISRSTWNACVENTTSNARSESRASISARRSRNGPISVTCTRSRRVVRVSMRRSLDSSSRCSAIRRRTRMSSLRVRSWVGLFRIIIFLLWKEYVFSYWCIAGRCSSLVLYCVGFFGGFAEGDVIWESHLGVSYGIAGRRIPYRRFFRVGVQELCYWGF